MVAAVACSALVAFAQDAVKPGVIGLDAEGNLVRQTVWGKYGNGVAAVFENGTATFTVEETKSNQGLVTSINVNQTEAKPIVFGAESKAENVSGAVSADYSFYLDITYTDGTRKFGVIAPFKTGTHDWEKSERRFVPDKPIKLARAHLLFRNKSGVVSFRNAFFNEEK